MEQMMADSFGEALRGFRKRRRLSQQTLAALLGVHRNTISVWERGDFLPESKTIVLEIARQLHLNDQETRLLLEASLTALSPYWYVPFPRNQFFTGREEILQALHQGLSAQKAVALTQSYALHGLGGIGKTHLALEYAYRHALEYSAVFWIEAETVERIIASFLAIAELLHLSTGSQTNHQQIVGAVQRWLSTHQNWLVIWDNLEDLDLLLQYLPTNRTGALLLTTRRQAIGTLAVSLEITPLSNEEGVTLLLRRSKRLRGLNPQSTLSSKDASSSEATELVHLLEGLPLALDQAGAYIEETGCNLEDYLRRYHEHRPLILARRGTDDGAHPTSVATTIQLAVEQVEQHHPAAANLLRACAFLYPEAIPEELFVTGASHLGPVLGPVVADSYQFDLTLAALRGASLLARHAETRTLSIHRLVQAVLQDQMEPDVTNLWSKRVLLTVNATFPEPTFEVWAQCERCLAQALTCIQLLKTTGTHLPEAGALSYKTGKYLLLRGRYKEATSLLEQALLLGEQQYGLDHPMLIPRLKGQAELLWRQGQYEQATPLLQRILAIGERHLHPEDPEIAETLNNLASIYHSQGKYADAEPLYQRALHLQEQQLGFDHLEVADTLTNLAYLYGGQGKYEQAESLYQRVLCIQEQQLGPQHPKISIPLANLALTYWQQGKYEQAEPLYQRALHIRELQLGPEHPDMAVSLNNLANMYREQGKYEQAEPLYQRALHIQKQQLDDEHPQLAHIFVGLASLYRNQGKYEQAEPLYQRALHIQEQRLGPEHPDIANTFHDLAVFRHKQGKLDEAISLAQRALMIHSQSLGDAHPKTVTAHTHYAQLLQELKGDEV
jgi:tetratricopeptide (TPR) repeat protein